MMKSNLMSEFGSYLTAVLFIYNCLVDSPRARRLCSLFTFKHVIVSRFDIYVDFVRWTKKYRLLNYSILSVFYVYGEVFMTKIQTEKS